MSVVDVNAPVEFSLSRGPAAVRLKTVRTRNGIRLEVNSTQTGRFIRLDPVILESLTWQTPETFLGMMEASDWRQALSSEDDKFPGVEPLHLPEEEAAAQARADAAEAEAVLSNEFATVYVRRADPCLEIRSPRAQYGISLDPIALEGLVYQTPEALSGLLETPFGPEA